MVIFDWKKINWSSMNKLSMHIKAPVRLCFHRWINNYEVQRDHKTQNMSKICMLYGCTAPKWYSGATHVQGNISWIHLHSIIPEINIQLEILNLSPHCINLLINQDNWRLTVNRFSCCQKYCVFLVTKVKQYVL